MKTNTQHWHSGLEFLCFLYPFEIEYFPVRYTLTDMANGQSSDKEAIRMNRVDLMRAD